MRAMRFSSGWMNALSIALVAIPIGLFARCAPVDTLGEPMSAGGRTPYMALIAPSVPPRIEVLPYEPAVQKEKGFIVNLFRYVWLVGLLLIGVPVIWRGFAWLRKRWRYRAPTHCKSCGYDLSHCAEPGCPECGAGRVDGIVPTTCEGDSEGRSDDC